VARFSRDDPFALTFHVPVAGGELHVAQAGPPPTAAKGVVLVAHGMTPGLMIWRTVARRLDPSICFLARDAGTAHGERLPAEASG
jgi:hypothetical protein